jgi:hypothetical protein
MLLVQGSENAGHPTGCETTLITLQEPTTAWLCFRGGFPILGSRECRHRRSRSERSLHLNGDHPDCLAKHGGGSATLYQSFLS